MQLIYFCDCLCNYFCDYFCDSFCDCGFYLPCTVTEISPESFLIR